MLRAPLLTIACLTTSSLAWGFGTGAAGYSNIRAGINCSGCHADTGAAPTVAISGPASLSPGATGDYTLTVSGGPGVRAGMNVALNGGGTLQADGVSTKLQGAEVVHTGPRAFAGGSSVFNFKLVAPAAPGVVTLFGAGNSCNGDLNTTGDHAQFTTLAVTVQAVAPPSTPPTIASAARAAESPVTRNTVALSVLGADDGGEGALTYTWSATAGPAPVTFSANGNNAAKATTATFSRPGDYSFTVTVRDASNGTITSTVAVSVVPTFSAISIAPQAITVVIEGTQQFTGTAVDQFGTPVANGPAITWVASGGGTISPAGLFTAGATAGGPNTITASGGGKSGTARVTVAVAGAPSFADIPAASPVLAKTSRLEALGIDDGGEALLTYTWSATGPSAVSFNPNGNNGAKNSTANFTKAGTYLISVTMKDGEGLTSDAEFEVVVEQKLASLDVNPSTASVLPGGRQEFAAVMKDQFGTIMVDSGFTWTVTGGGAIDERGRFEAQRGTLGGPFLVSAWTVGVRGSAEIRIAGLGDGVDPNEVVGGCATLQGPPVLGAFLLAGLFGLALRRKK